MPADAAEIVRLAEALTDTQRLDLTERWDQFCDKDELSGNRDPDEYTADLLLDGFADMRGVEPDDLDNPFAYERGIEEGGWLYELTPLGRALRDHLRARAAQHGHEVG
jgi:hypothetical protein